MPADPTTLYRLIVEIRGAFNDLKAFSDAANADLAITAAMRAVMEHVAGKGPAAVPDIARSKNVTRQHIQQLADALVAAGFAEWRDNPRHKRSQLLALTPEGENRFAEIRKREAVALSRIAGTLDGGDVDQAVETVAGLRKALGG